MKHQTFAQIRLDETFVSYGRTVTETDIVQFTCLAGLKLPIFIDAAYCREHSPFGQRIVPGLLIQAFAAGMMEELIGPYTIAALGFGESRFLRPAVIGDTLHTHSRVASKRLSSKPGRGVIDIAIRVTNQRQETVMEGSYRLLMRTGDAGEGIA
ncbi:MaoC/PaaZ C-terminal domain-containing protein [Ramlibacter sp. H39-3-26]|uniref:MaoC family dehydratase n=1 Tax=Curvibacter soli TaxID=3031331 RepID=UPI0023DA5E7C|nr:MaoC/PaaZ C-terminal domain-containing protein [Ramlibacter sp. H39-3-26]MDF1486548.1 MaoC/PaaZ C-terminal domain-containing protein [Ramlibacter sp. H39-3-26]